MFLYLYLFEGNLEREALVVVRVEGAFLNRRLLLLDPFSVQQQRDLHVRICDVTSATDSASTSEHVASCIHLAQHSALRL